MFHVDAWVITLIAIALAVLIYFIVIWIIHTYQRHLSAGKEGLVGETAIVKVVLQPKGVVHVEGELWTAILDKGRAEPDEEVIITKVEGMKLRVTKKG